MSQAKCAFSLSLSPSFEEVAIGRKLLLDRDYMWSTNTNSLSTEEVAIATVITCGQSTNIISYLILAIGSAKVLW